MRDNSNLAIDPNILEKVIALPTALNNCGLYGIMPELLEEIKNRAEDPEYSNSFDENYDVLRVTFADFLDQNSENFTWQNLAHFFASWKNNTDKQIILGIVLRQFMRETMGGNPSVLNRLVDEPNLIDEDTKLRDNGRYNNMSPDELAVFLYQPLGFSLSYQNNAAIDDFTEIEKPENFEELKSIKLYHSGNVDAGHWERSANQDARIDDSAEAELNGIIELFKSGQMELSLLGIKLIQKAAIEKITDDCTQFNNLLKSRAESIDSDKLISALVSENIIEAKLARDTLIKLLPTIELPEFKTEIIKSWQANMAFYHFYRQVKSLDADMGQALIQEMPIAADLKQSMLEEAIELQDNELTNRQLLEPIIQLFQEGGALQPLAVIFAQHLGNSADFSNIDALQYSFGVAQDQVKTYIELRKLYTKEHAVVLLQYEINKANARLSPFTHKFIENDRSPSLINPKASQDIQHAALFLQESPLKRELQRYLSAEHLSTFLQNSRNWEAIKQLGGLHVALRNHLNGLEFPMHNMSLVALKKLYSLSEELGNPLESLNTKIISALMIRTILDNAPYQYSAAEINTYLVDTDSLTLILEQQANNPTFIKYLDQEKITANLDRNLFNHLLEKGKITADTPCLLKRQQTIETFKTISDLLQDKKISDYGISKWNIALLPLYGLLIICSLGLLIPACRRYGLLSKTPDGMHQLQEIVEQEDPTNPDSTRLSNALQNLTSGYSIFRRHVTQELYKNMMSELNTHQSLHITNGT